MQPSKRYIHDRIVLVLLTTSAFFTVLTSLLLALRFNSGRNEGYIVQYRPSLGTISRYFAKGDQLDFLSFAVFAAIVFVLHTYLSIKVYHVRRQLSLIILGMGLLLIILAMVISNALLLLG